MGMVLFNMVDTKSHSLNYRRTISLRHSDGSFKDLGRVEGDSSYIETIRRLLSHSACHHRYISQYELSLNVQLPPY
jgi:hypothetical protein